MCLDVLRDVRNGATACNEDICDLVCSGVGLGAIAGRSTGRQGIGKFVDNLFDLGVAEAGRHGYEQVLREGCEDGWSGQKC